MLLRIAIDTLDYLLGLLRVAGLLVRALVFTILWRVVPIVLVFAIAYGVWIWPSLHGTSVARGTEIATRLARGSGYAARAVYAAVKGQLVGFMLDGSNITEDQAASFLLTSGYGAAAYCVLFDPPDRGQWDRASHEQGAIALFSLFNTNLGQRDCASLIKLMDSGLPPAMEKFRWNPPAWLKPVIGG